MFWSDTWYGCVCAVAKRSLPQLRQLYFRMKDKVFKNERLGFSYNTDALEEILQEEFGEITMSEVEFPR